MQIRGIMSWADFWKIHPKQRLVENSIFRIPGRDEDRIARELIRTRMSFPEIGLCHAPEN